MIVIDASVLSNVVGDDGPSGHLARDVLRAADEVAAPDLVDVETTAVLRKRWLVGALSEERFGLAIDDLEQLDVARYPVLTLMRRAYDLRANVSAYDAAYVALAERLECELVTADRRLSNATGVRCPIRGLLP